MFAWDITKQLIQIFHLTSTIPVSYTGRICVIVNDKAVTITRIFSVSFLFSYDIIYWFVVDFLFYAVNISLMLDTLQVIMWRGTRGRSFCNLNRMCYIAVVSLALQCIQMHVCSMHCCMVTVFDWAPLGLLYPPHRVTGSDYLSQSKQPLTYEPFSPRRILPAHTNLPSTVTMWRKINE